MDKSYHEILILVRELQIEVDRLRKENAELKARIHELEHPKNSNNSSIPPSQDENRPRKNQSLREKSGRKSGGQKGHKGHALDMISNPDKVVHNFPDVCKVCGKETSIRK